MEQISAQKDAELELSEQNKVISLFEFIRELNKLKQKAILDIKKYPWLCALSELPEDPENITVRYRDRVAEAAEDNAVLLSVHKPRFHKCPQPDAVLLDWLEPGWDDYKKELQVKEYLPKESDDKRAPEETEAEEPERFSDDPARVAAFDTWKPQRDLWVEKQLLIEKTRELFSSLYRLYFELQKDSETQELIVANGMLYDRENSEIRHPVLTRRVKLNYDPDQDTVSIEDTDAPSELFSVVFQMMEDVNLSAINQLSSDLQANDYHPLDRNDTPGFLKVLVHQLSSESLFSDGSIPDNWKKENRLLMALEPHFIFRKRLDGTLKAIELIIENINETGEIPAPIGDIVSGGMIEVPEDTGEQTVEEQLAAVGGESVDILLSKQANKEQLEIARRIEYYNAVLVQGPPGTGKTHTIANLMGHFLAQGKSVLVTSYTSKALRVLKEKVAPGLQSLCVSILDDSNTDMERSVDGITDYMASHSSYEIKREMDALETARKEIIRKLSKVRRDIFTLINQENNCIVLNGENLSPSKAAAFVCEHAEDLSYIPGDVSLYHPLPLTFSELTKLYKSNTAVSEGDEKELNYSIPAPTEILSPREFQQAVEKVNQGTDALHEIERKQGWTVSWTIEDNEILLTGDFGELAFPAPSEEAITGLRDYAKSFGTVAEWKKRAAVDGKNGGGYRQLWETLVSLIQKTNAYADSLVTEQFGKDIWFDTADLDALKNALSEIRGIFQSKGKITKFTLMRRKDLSAALSQATINGHQVQDGKECSIVLNAIELMQLRSQCADYWNHLLAGDGVPAFHDLDRIQPEKIAEKWINSIQCYLDWYSTVYQKLSDCLTDFGIDQDIVFRASELDSDMAATGKILEATESTIPDICDICLAVLSIQEASKKLENTTEILSTGNRNSSITCSELTYAVDSKDISAYSAAYEQLARMYEKYDLLEQRNLLLSSIEEVAPVWAEAIRNRQGMHGEATVPASICDAWKWKQLTGILDGIMKQPFTELQAESVRLSSEYRKITAAYAERRAWYYLLTRTEADLDLRQALQGWKQTVKRIGKGTGKTAPKFKAEARKLMEKCQSAVPGWIMPINRALESLNPKTNRFDIIIIDEASQADVSSLAILYMGRKLIIVGDDKQVSPMAVGVQSDKMESLEQMYLRGKIPNSHLYNAKTSIYDIALTTFQPLMLREHFRCVPEIIGFSNMLSYEYKIKPLRDASNSVLLPAVVSYRVADGHRDDGKKTNTVEAQAIVSLLQACIEQPEYAGKTFGIISLLGDEQVKVLQQLIELKIDSKEIFRRSILCGNSANFQGDERDVVFLSVVDSGNGNGPIHMQNYGVDDAIRKRYNVAASRARDQLWVVHSLDPANDLKPGDLRKTLIDYAVNPKASEIRKAEIEEKSESPFEASVALALSDRGYHLVHQRQVGAYRLDIVAVCGEKTVAIECDGERWHSGEAKIREDMERQTILERLGWRFIRIRGSEYYRDSEGTINRVIEKLRQYGIEPEEAAPVPIESRDTELLNRVKARAQAIIESFGTREIESEIDTIKSALDPEKLVKANPVGQSKSAELPDGAHDAAPMHASSASSGVSNTVQHEHQRTPSAPIPEKPRRSITSGKDFPESRSKEKTQKTRKAKAQLPEQQMLPGMVSENELSATQDVIALLKKQGVKFIDKRSSNGSLWIIGGKELTPIVEECLSFGVKFNFKETGGKLTGHKPSWWAK